MAEAKTFTGGCHCQAIRFRVTVRKFQAVDCNCSICSKKGFLHLIVPPEDFELLQGEDHLATYTFNTGIAKHYFCKTCGIHSFYRPRSHPNDYDVNLRCLDDWWQPEVQAQFEIKPFDGQNWEQRVDGIR
ncbi:GFA family protein [Synechococcus sp. PCC 6312]|uniref:GFA family protein n=1 Tax=Synechococcus sp. (strain ATCC 27167 / PCC 6312) TaxID=195253 RepID=UPI00029ED58F|nr:GFA family protein [Synechococcus sp. PCC 6312]AFY61689.1 hypothetical protein Syn6312_2591 [Synechococcus sp. PCC 6312]